MQQPPQTPSFNPAASPNAITTEQIQKCLDDNKNLILAIMENQNLGKFQECAQYQALLQKNLMYLAAIADAQPPPPTPTPAAPTPPTSNPSQMMQMPLNANNYMQQQQQGGGGGGQKLPFQMNSLRTQDQQQQLLHFQQQQQLQAQMGIGMRPGGPNGMLAMHQAMQSALAGNPGGGDGKGKPRGPGGNRDL